MPIPVFLVPTNHWPALRQSREGWEVVLALALVLLAVEVAKTIQAAITLTGGGAMNCLFAKNHCNFKLAT